MKTAAPSCASCGSALSPSTLDGLCPKCVGEIIFSPATAEEIAVAVKTAIPATKDFGPYELLEEIARGGMGVVFKARHLPLNRIVAVKMMLTGKLAGLANAQRFQVETTTVAQLQHPNIVAIHEAGEYDGYQFFSMDYVDGVDFAELVRREKLPVRRAAAYLKIVAEAIHYAHQQGVIHRDLKPSNILLDVADQPRVTDFGLAKRLTGMTDSDLPLTVTGQILGTPAFIPPEQAGGNSGAVGPRSDVYSLGAVLYFMLTGRPPFSGRSLEATLSQVIQSAPILPRTINPAVPRDLEILCLKCLEKEPTQRFASAQELADDLGRFLRGEPIIARPVSGFEKFWRICKRHPAIVVLSASLTLTLIVLLTLLASRWTSLFEKQVVPDMPIRSASGLSGVIDGKLYVTTLADGTAGFRNNFHVYDPRRNDWKKLSEPPIPHGNGASGVIDGKLYAVGGCDWNGTVAAQLDVFDPSTGKWKTRRPMHTAHANCAGAVFDGKFYVLGGGTTENFRQTTFESYDPQLDVWTVEKPLPTPRNNVGAAILAGKLYVIGGAIGLQPSAIVEIYDFAARKWISGPALPEGRYYSFITAQNRILYVAGGQNLAMQNNLWALKPDDTQWQLLAPMPEARYGGDGAQAVAGKIWFIGGWTQDGTVHANIFIYDPKLNSWTSSK